MEREFVTYKTGYCAKCGNLIEEWDGSEIDGYEVHFYYSCPVCGGAGCETYVMEFTHNSCIVEE